MTAQAPLPWRTAWIVGGSTGIGKDLALRLARAGVKVAISARSAGPLSETAALHQNLHAEAADAASPESMKGAYARIVEAVGAPDLVVLNAAIWDPMSANDYSAARAIKSMQVNYGGVCNAIEIILRTDPYERVMKPAFGAGLRRFLFAANSPVTHRRVE